VELLPKSASDGDILDLIRRWVELLAGGRYAEALQLLDARSHWTPELLERVIRNYGSPDPTADGSTYRVTSLATATDDLRPRHEIERYSSGRASVLFDLPLNGRWSDLTACFDVEEGPTGLRLVLDDVHVL